MRIVIAPDSFKECLSGTRMAAAIYDGAKKVIPEVGITCIPVIALAGKIEGDLTELYRQGITSVFVIGDRLMSLEKSKERAAELLSAPTEQIMRTITVFAKK